MTRGRRRRPERSEVSSEPEAAAEETRTAIRYGLVMAGVFAAIGLLLLVLSVFGRGWPYLLGAVDFIVIAGVLAWVARSAQRQGGR